MSKSKNISYSLPLCAQRILPIMLRGVFDWNGELFACPHITLEDKKKPFSLSTWKKELKSRKNTPVFFDQKFSMLLFFADPADPRTFKKLRMRVMDKHFGINKKTKVYLVGNTTVIIKNNQRIDTIRFVKPLTDAERLKMFPMVDPGCTLRGRIFELSKPGASMYKGGISLENALKKWEELQKTG